MTGGSPSNLPPPPSDWDPARAEAARRVAVRTPWTGGRFAGVFAAWIGGGVIGIFAAAALGLDPAEDPAGLAVTVMTQGVAALAVVVSVSRNSGTGSLSKDLGLRFHARDAVAVLWGMGLQVAVALLLSPLVRLLSDDFDTQQQVADLAESTSDPAGRAVLVLMFVVVAPFVEEIIFRGVMLSWLSKRMSPWWAISLSAAGFAAVHLADPNAVFAVPGLFAIGMVLGWVSRRRGNIGIAVFMHAGVNLLGAILLIWRDPITEFFEDQLDNVQSLAAALGLG